MRRPARRGSKRKTPELSIQSRPLCALHAFQIGRVQGRSRYSEMLVARNAPAVAVASARAAGVRSGISRP